METAAVGAEDREFREAEAETVPSSSKGGGGGILTVSKAEWEKIEDVPGYTRAVGDMFQLEAQALRSAAAEASSSSVRKKAFSHRSLQRLQSGQYTTNSCGNGAPRGAAQKSKTALLHETTAKAIFEKDLDKAMHAASQATPPRLETFSPRIESFTFAVLCWLRKQSPYRRAVAAHKFEAWLGNVCADLPPELLEELQAFQEAGDVHELLEETCIQEDALILDHGLGALKLHEEQKTLARAVHSSVESQKPLLLRYETPPSGGKSSATALLGAVLADQKLSFVIYACYSRPVRIDVCKHLIAASVPFAIFVQGIASPSYTCYYSGKGKKPHAPPPPGLEERVPYSMRILGACDRRPIALVCDLLSARLLLEQRTKDVLVFDEPTADLTKALVKDVKAILRLSPARTILMSATVPPFDGLGAYVAHMERRHPGLELLDLRSKRLPRSVTALSPSGQLLAPHELGASLEDIRREGHLQRFYSPQVLRAMRPQPSELSAKDLLSYDSIRGACLRILETRGGALAQPLIQVPLDLSKACTEHAHFLPGTSLVVSEDPRLMERAVAANLEGVPSLRRLLRSSASARKKEETSKRGAAAASAEERRAELQTGWLEDEDDQGLLHKRFVVNSKPHLVRYAAQDKVPTQLYRSRLYIPEQVLETSSEAHVEAALCGVLYLGLEETDPAFEAASLVLAERGQESFVAGGKSLVYGLNLPFDRLVVACQSLSRSELVQLCGRIGRSGKGSTKAEIVFLSKRVARMALTAGPPSEEPSSGGLFEICS